MVHYRRNRVPGGTYFFTATLADRRSDLLVTHAAELREAFRAVAAERPFRVDAIVILPEHLHAIWTLPEGDADYPGRWRSIKARFSRLLVTHGVRLPRDARGGYVLWQPRYWEHTIRDETDFARHVDYIHVNPLKHGLVPAVRDWPYSSFHRYVEAGLLSPDWGGEGVDELKAGEPG